MQLFRIEKLCHCHAIGSDIEMVAEYPVRPRGIIQCIVVVYIMLDHGVSIAVDGDEWAQVDAGRRRVVVVVRIVRHAVDDLLMHGRLERIDLFFVLRFFPLRLTP